MSKYVLNTWYPLTWSRNVGRELSAHRVVERDVVLFRSQDGKVVAMEDACPHRLLPLSMGRLKGDAIECGYHGVVFDCTGKCMRVPGQEMIPANAVVTFPTHENMGLVWIWMGDPALADVSKVFDLPQYHDPAWSAVEGDAQVYRTNYLSLCDNLCDPAHVSFVHQTTLGNSAGDDIRIQYEKQDGKIVTWDISTTLRQFRCLRNMGTSQETWTAGNTITITLRASLSLTLVVLPQVLVRKKEIARTACSFMVAIL